MKILDASSLRDDFYLDVLDWSNKDRIGIVLGDVVYSLKYQDESVEQICQSPIDDFFASIRFSPSGNLLAIGTDNGTI